MSWLVFEIASSNSFLSPSVMVEDLYEAPEGQSEDWIEDLLFFTGDGFVRVGVLFCRDGRVCSEGPCAFHVVEPEPDANGQCPDDRNDREEG